MSGDIRMTATQSFAKPLAALAVAASVLAAPGPAHAQTSGIINVSADATMISSASWKPTDEQAIGMQRRLKELGFDPGPPDGSIGPRTTAALRAFQRSIGTTPDGKLTADLYQRIIGPAETQPASQVEDAAMPYAVAGPSQPAIAEPFSHRDCGDAYLWSFTDSLGSSFSLMLLGDGTVDGPTSPGQWRWKTQSEGIEIVYDNGMGQRVTRIGHLNGDDRMAGEATDAMGRAWNWRAERTAVPAASKFDCQTSSAQP